jgi:transcriptional regulator with XRE-family HTH domain
VPREVLFRGDPPRVAFGRRVRELRESAGIRQADLADRAGLSGPYLSGVENGHRNPTLDVIAALAYALRVPMASLFDGESLSS